jgi:5'-nucleotidase
MRHPTRALVTNDDGIHSPGLLTLARVAAEAGLDVVVAAPHEDRSGTSASLVATRDDDRLMLERVELDGLPGVPAYAIEASPAYIIRAALGGAFSEPPDLVLSGVNLGPNSGRAVLHSGTVGAALTATAHGLPALAVSMAGAGEWRWDTAAHVVGRVLEWLLQRGVNGEDAGPVTLNLNIPDVALDDLRGVRVAPLATVGATQAEVGEAGEGYVTITFSESAEEIEPDSDTGLHRSGWATLTALTGPREIESFSFDGLV